MSLLKSCLFATAVSIVLTFCISLLLAERQAGSDIFEAQCCRTDLLTFWDRGKVHFHGELHTDTQRPMTSDHMPDFPLLSFHSLLKSPTSVSRAGQNWPASWGLWPNTALLKSCLRQLSLYSAGSCISLLLAKRQTGSDIFEAQCCRTGLLTFWGRGKLHLSSDFFECIFTAKAPAGCLPVLVGPRSLCVGTCVEIILRVGYPTFRKASE